jgi:transposase
MAKVTYVGMDVHKKSIQVAMLLPDRMTPVIWDVINEERAVKRLCRKLQREAEGRIECCYEAGPCGYVLQRQMSAVDINCVVIAPSLIPRKPGDRVKTNRRDSRKLAELLRAGMLTEVVAPTPEQEAVRDLCRCLAATKADLQRCRNRLGKFLLRRGFVYAQGCTWTHRHRLWVSSLRMAQGADQLNFDSLLLAVEQTEERIKSLKAQIEQQATNEPYREPVAWLCCFRGISTLTALTLVTEIGDIRRFGSARELMAYWGLTPSERSTGEKQTRGNITKAGSCHARRVLVEASWHYRHKPAVGIRLRRRRDGQPPRVIGIADRAQQRLYRRYWKLHMVSGKLPQVAIVALARELVGFVWATLWEHAAAHDVAA